MGAIERMQELSREMNVAQAHTEAFVTGLDLTFNVTLEHFKDIPPVGDPLHDHAVALAAESAASAIRARALALEIDPSDREAMGIGGKVGMEEAASRLELVI